MVRPIVGIMVWKWTFEMKVAESIVLTIVSDDFYYLTISEGGEWVNIGCESFESSNETFGPFSKGLKFSKVMGV